MARGWLIYQKEDLVINKQFAQALLDYGQQEGLQIDLLERESLQIGIQKGELVVKIIGDEGESPKFVINRTRDSLLAYQLEQMGIKVFNSYKVTHICNHKARTHQLVAPLGMKSVDSLFYHKNYMRLEACWLNYPIVIKSPIGHGGKEVYLAQDIKEAYEMMARIDGEEVIIQELCSRVGIDVRVFVLGNEIIGAVCRESQTDFRSNYSLGGKVSLYELSEEEIKKVGSILEVLPCDYVGIDFMIDHKGEFVFNEIEDVVGCRSLYQCSDINVAKDYMIYIAQCIKQL